MPNTNEATTAVKRIKDFNDEEKAAILARAKRIEPARVAKEFNTTWQVVVAIQKQAQKPAKKTQAKASKSGKAAKKVVKTKKATKSAAAGTQKKTTRGSRFTEQERLEILKRASEIGATNAAAEAGISKWTVFQWKKTMKKAGYDVPKSARGRVATSSAKKATKSEAPAPKAKEELAAKVSTKKANAYSSLEFENALLKEKVATLTAQVAKLREAIAKLA